MDLKPRPKRGLRYWLNLAVFFVLTLYLAGIVVIPAVYSAAYVRPARHEVCCVTPEDFGFAYEEVAFATADGLILRGWYISSQNGAAVVFLHGYGGDRLGTFDQALGMARRGYGVLLYDQRASGESDGERRSWGWLDVPDVSAAVDYLHTRPDLDPGRVGVYGCSTGAEIALAATALDERLKAVVPEDAEYATYRDFLPFGRLPLGDQLTYPFYPIFLKFMEWRSGARALISLSEASARIHPRPVLFISNGQSYDFWQAEQYFALAGAPKEHWNLPESAHCQALVTRPAEFERRLAEFFDRALE